MFSPLFKDYLTIMTILKTTDWKRIIQIYMEAMRANCLSIMVPQVSSTISASLCCFLLKMHRKCRVFFWKMICCSYSTKRSINWQFDWIDYTCYNIAHWHLLVIIGIAKTSRSFYFFFFYTNTVIFILTVTVFVMNAP